MRHSSIRRVGKRPARGFTLVELMISITIAIFLTGALLTLVQAMKRTSGVQGGLSQLQDNQRMAMSLIADVVETAGYFPNPLVNTPASEFPIAGSFTYAGQSVVGTGAFGDPAQPGNTLSVRYATGGTVVVPPAGPDNTVDCTGNTSAVPTMFTNTFSIAPSLTTAGTYDLVCVLVNSAAGTTTTVHLVSGVTQLQIYYGVRSNTGVSTGSVDTYMDAATVTANNDWPNVNSAKVTLTFVNPLYGNLAGQNMNADTPQTIAFTRVIDVMNKTGVTSP